MAFSVACSTGDEETVKKLTESYQDLDAGLVDACYAGHINIVKFLMTKRTLNLDRGMATAAYTGHVDIVEFLVDNGACDFSDALTNANSRGNQKILKFLILKLGYIPYFIYKLSEDTTYQLFKFKVKPCPNIYKLCFENLRKVDKMAENTLSLLLIPELVDVITLY